MKKMKIGTKLLMSFLLAVMISSLAGIASMFLMHHMDTTYGNALTDYGFLQGDIGKLGMDFQAHRTTVLYLIQETDSARRSELKDELQVYVTSIAADMDELDQDCTLPADKEFCADLRNLMDEYTVARDETIRISDRSSDEATAYFRANAAPLAKELSQQINTMLTEKSTAGNIQSKTLTKQARTSLITNILILVAAIVISVLIALRLTRSFVRPLKEIEKAAKETANGNFQISVTYSGQDELGQLSDSIRRMTENIRIIIKDISICLAEMARGNFDIQSTASDAYQGEYVSIHDSIFRLRDNLNSTLSEIDTAARQVDSGGQQVSNSAQALAQGTTEQASSVEELAASFNEISNQVENTAEHARVAKEENQYTHDQIEICSSHMNQMMDAMHAIEEKSQEIHKVIKAIEDIAFQTNILALNAAVEAARAGEAGKGFAVVADEVRSLATRSQEASKGTTALIDDTVRAVAEGTQLSNDTNKALHDVIMSAQKVLEEMTLISDATEEQADSIAQVTLGIDQISSVVQTNSATAEQSAAASEELSSQADLLKKLVSQFNLARR
ncbi:MAG: HAMP domain-containing protein [Dorea sp.]|nr:HAMP domain-containing protein [Dorea sp.]